MADEIAAKANTKYVKLERVDEIEAQTKHDIAALVKAIGEVCDNDAGEYVHFGATSNDVVDSSNSLLLNDSIEVLKEKVEKLSIPIPINSKGEFDLEAQKEIAEKYRKIEQIKKSISAELDKIANIEIDYE